MGTGTWQQTAQRVQTPARAAVRTAGLVKTYPASGCRRGRGRGRLPLSLLPGALRRGNAPARTASTDGPSTDVPSTDETAPVRACDGVTLTVRQGEIFGLLGPNGAGKSTLVRQLTGLMRPDSGTVEVLGHDLVRHPERAARILAYLGQESGALDELTVALAAETTGRLRGLDAAAARRESDDVLAELGLTALAGRPLKRLSGGQRRLACVASALVGERPLLVLDEPTTGMDPVARRAVWSAVERRRTERGATVVLVTHNVLEAETVLDRVAVLDRGRVIACDTPGGLKAMVGGDVRLDLVWRDQAPLDEPRVASLAGRATVSGRRWTLRLPPEEARAAVDAVTTGRAFAALDDFSLATPSLEDVYLALGGSGEGLVKV